MTQLERCRAWLEPALAKGRERFPWSELEARLSENTAQLWPGAAAAIVTELSVTVDGRCCHIWLAGGDIQEIAAMQPGVSAWARAQGATHATMCGRKGWARFLKRYGWRPAGAELRLEL